MKSDIFPLADIVQNTSKWFYEYLKYKLSSDANNGALTKAQWGTHAAIMEKYAKTMEEFIKARTYDDYYVHDLRIAKESGHIQIILGKGCKPSKKLSFGHSRFYYSIDIITGLVRSYERTDHGLYEWSHDEWK